MTSIQNSCDAMASVMISELSKARKTITTIESCTGGMVASELTSVPGSSAVFREGFVTYSDEAKHKLVGVKKKTLKKYTAVSAPAAAQMACCGAKRARADLAISVTGYAGPAGDENGEDVGLVYIGCYYKGKTKVREYHFSGSRNTVRRKACTEALWLAYHILNYES